MTCLWMEDGFEPIYRRPLAWAEARVRGWERIYRPARYEDAGVARVDESPK